MPKSAITSRGLIAACLLVVSYLFAGAAAAQPQLDELPDFSRQGADTCIGCHDGDSDVLPVLDIFQTPHGVVADQRTPFANQQCETCHGPGTDHGRRLRPGQERPPVIAFGKNSIWSNVQENKICADCHQGTARTHWDGSEHQRQDLNCADCHTVHATHDPVTVRDEQPTVCFQCHTRERAESLQPSTHPIRQGQMACSDCHEPHGSLTEAMLIRPTLNETCYECHAEKRGPFLWEHAPAAENCANCHNPHGSIHQGMLERRAPLLCQECHSRAGHPSIAHTGSGLPGNSPSSMLLGNSCTNCHSQVHGSNHPSGANLSR